MRFIYGSFFGSLVATVLGVTVCSAWFKPGVESYPEYIQLRRDFEHVSQEKFHVEVERGQLKRKLTLLELDTLRRSQRDPVNPDGPVVPVEDRIAPHAVPIPAPAPATVNPKDEMSENGNEKDQPQQEEGEEEVMATATKSTALVRSPGTTLVINSVNEMMELAKILYLGGASQLPNVDRPEKVFHLILHGQEIGLTPTQALAGLQMGKNGKVSIGGDAALALVLQSGLLEDIKEFIEGGDDPQKGVCIVKRKGFPEQRQFEFTLAQAEQAGLIKRAKGEKGDGPWLAYRFRMLRYRPLGFALRDVFPDVLKGLYLTEELQDPAHDSSIVNTEVRVLGTTADVPQRSASEYDAPPQAPVSTMTPTATVAESVIAPKAQQQIATESPASLTGPITMAQKEELAGLHKLVMASKALTEPAAKKAAWEQTLAPYGVSSMNQMDAATAAKAIAEIGRQHDPFGHPTGATSGLTT